MTALLAPGVEVDRATSTITLGGQRFPAVGVRCPGPYPEDPEDRLLGGRWVHPTLGGWELDVYVPAESGVLVNVTVEHGGLDLTVQHRQCEAEHEAGAAVFYLPQWLHAHQGALHPYPLHRPRTPSRAAYAYRRAHWQDCDPEWAAEHIARLLAMPAHPEPGPACELVPLGQCPWSA